MTQQLGNYLRSLREKKGYSTRQLAAQVDRSQSLITAIENGERSPSLLRLWEIIKALNGEFRLALFYLCVDLGIPEEAVRGIYQNHQE